jgi:predicted aspartyl protease
MGFVQVKVGLEKISGAAQRREIELLADTGALYSIVPANFLRELGIEPRERMAFELADGRTIERDVGEARFYCDARASVSSVIFGEEGDASVLGVVTLEELGLQVDPVGKKLRPGRLILY